MTPQQLLAAAEAGTLDMDVDASVGGVAADDAAANTQQTSTDDDTKQPAPVAAQDDEQPAPIASKSGDYTIPYEKLTEARAQRDAYKVQVEALQAQVASLSATQQANINTAQADAQARADAGQAPTTQDANLATAATAIEQGVDVAIFGDFSEEDIAKGVATLVEQRAAAIVDERLKAALAPMREKEVKSARDEHFATIYGKHADADEVFESAEFKAWVNGQPSYARAAIENTMVNGNATQIVEVFDAFKGATGRATSVADKVDRAIKSATQPVPSSLSDVPGAPAGISVAERIAAASGNPTAMLSQMDGLTPAQLEKLMDSVV